MSKQSECEVRELRLGDLVPGSGFFETLTHLRKDPKIDYDRMIEIFQKRAEHGVVTYVIVVNERIVSTTSIVFEYKFIHNGGLIAHVEDVATREGAEYEKHGYASMLLQKAIALAKERGAYKLILDCSWTNVIFYVKQGLRPIEVCMRIDL
ncbi:MAG: GNAT family N-acetyltransferase [Candidatus Andersenbacteria bacterium]|nr:GNAT family N-acetyltransferase [Candidatus Andersenbacteria bacterium]